MRRKDVGSVFDSNRNGGVRALIAISFFEFLTRTNRFHIGYAVDGENSIQMIDLVLQEFRQVAVVSGIERQSLAFEILIAHGDPSPPLNLHKDGEKAQASVPNDHSLLAGL